MLIGNEEDLQKGLGFEGPEVAASAKTASSKLDTGAFLGMMEQVVQALPEDEDCGDDAARGAQHEPS